jgi:GNAT superfamily N-acetyltransferase
MANEPAHREKINLDAVTIKPFDNSIRRKAFSCGKQNIDNFLIHSAPDQHKKSHCRVYYAIHDGALVGFYSLAAASRNADLISQQAIEYFERISNAPCVYLGMLGVHKGCQSSGIGKKLMIHAMETTVQVAELVGIYALILQAGDVDLGKMYKKWGFTYFLGEEEKPQPNMFIALETIKKGAAEAPS